MGIPVWITVVISRFIGGFITGFLGVAVFAAFVVYYWLPIRGEIGDRRQGAA